MDRHRGQGPAGLPAGLPRRERARHEADRRADALSARARPREVSRPGDRAEIIGTAIYHAIGYNVVDTYIVNVDPKKVRVAENATVRDASGRRRLTQRDIDEIFKLGAKNPDGTYRMSRRPVRRGTADGQLHPLRHAGRTIRTTSTRTSTGASFARTASSRRGSTTTTRAR